MTVTIFQHSLFIEVAIINRSYLQAGDLVITIISLIVYRAVTDPHSGYFQFEFRERSLVRRVICDEGESGFSGRVW